MPTTLVGLVIFVVLITPGFVYLLVIERGRRPGRSVSVFRETAAVTVASVASWVVTLIVFGIARSVLSIDGPKTKMVAGQSNRSFWENYGQLTAWLVGALIFTCLVAYLWAACWVPSKLAVALAGSQRLRWIAPPTDVQFVSAWWQALKVNEPTLARLVHCRLSDGSEVEGWLESFNSGSDETADRDLLLDAPVYYWRPDSDEVEIQEFGSVVVSARTIVFLRVEYRNRETMQGGAETMPG